MAKKKKHKHDDELTNNAGDVVADQAPRYSLRNRLVAEAFGTFWLVAAVIGTALFASSNTGYLGVALAVGLAVLGAAYAVGDISGGHFNPAVTLGVATAGRMRWQDVLPYIAAQIVGGLLATTIWFIVSALGPSGFLQKARDGGFASNGYGDRSPGGFSLGAVIITEFVLTAVFVLIILSVTAKRSTTPGFAPLAIGLTLTVVHLVAIPVSNASVNPARSIATAVYGGVVPLSQLWVFILVPLAGAAIAGLGYRYLFPPERTSRA